MNDKQFNPAYMRKKRKSRKMSVADLARRVGVEPEIISAYERGRHVPGDHILNKLSIALRCERADLVD